MKHFVTNESTSNENFTHVYSGISKGDLDKKIDKLFLSSGYKMKEGQVGKASYVKGNRVLRILFGAFVKYFKFHIETTKNSDAVKVTVGKETSGMSGGVIGINQVKKELKHLASLLETL